MEAAQYCWLYAYEVDADAVLAAVAPLALAVAGPEGHQALVDVLTHRKQLLGKMEHPGAP